MLNIDDLTLNELTIKQFYDLEDEFKDNKGRDYNFKMIALCTGLTLEQVQQLTCTQFAKLTDKIIKLNGFDQDEDEEQEEETKKKLLDYTG